MSLILASSASSVGLDLLGDAGNGGDLDLKGLKVLGRGEGLSFALSESVSEIIESSVSLLDRSGEELVNKSCICKISRSIGLIGDMSAERGASRCSVSTEILLLGEAVPVCLGNGSAASPSELIADTDGVQ